MQFVFTYTRWEGSATDARVYESALTDGLDISLGKYYLADAGFPFTDALLIPYHSILPNGVVPMSGTFFMVHLYEMMSKLIAGPKIKKNCLTFVMGQLTSLSTFLVS